MKKICPQCHAKMNLSKTTLHFERQSFYTDVENVSAYICSQCGTRSIAGGVAKKVSEMIEHLYKNSLHQTDFTGISFIK